MSSSLQHHHHQHGTHVRSSRTSLAHPVKAFAKRGSQHAVTRPSHGAVLQQLVSPSPSTKPGQCPEAQYAQWAQSVAVSTPTVTPTTTTITPTTTTTSSSSSQQLVQSRVLRDHLCIRHLCQERDLMAVAQLQATSFHEPLAAPLSALDPMAFTMFKAEVLSAVQNKTKVLAEDGFTILVVEDCSATASAPPSSPSSSSGWDAAASSSGSSLRRSSSAPADSAAASSSSSSSILGVIEVGVQDEHDVLQHLPKGVETYAYISSMAVASHMRRSGLGTALLQAAEQQAVLWGQQLLALHVYETNDAAIKLYESHGLTSHAADPAWRRYVGGKVRQLMVKWL